MRACLGVAPVLAALDLFVLDGRPYPDAPLRWILAYQGLLIEPEGGIRMQAGFREISAYVDMVSLGADSSRLGPWASAWQDGVISSWRARYPAQGERTDAALVSWSEFRVAQIRSWDRAHWFDGEAQEGEPAAAWLDTTERASIHLHRRYIHG